MSERINIDLDATDNDEMSARLRLGGDVYVAEQLKRSGSRRNQALPRLGDCVPSRRKNGAFNFPFAERNSHRNKSCSVFKSCMSVRNNIHRSQLRA